MRLDARFELKGDTLSAVLQIPAEDLSYRPLNGTTACTLEIAIAERAPQGLLGIRHELGSFALKDGQADDLTAVTVRFPKQWTIDSEDVIDSPGHPRSLHRPLRHARRAGGSAALK